MTLGEFIRKHREQAGLNQTNASKLAGLARYQTKLSKIETNKYRLFFDDAVQLSRVLSFDLGDLAALIPEPEYCLTCVNEPPKGFRCNTCGRSS